MSANTQPTAGAMRAAKTINREYVVSMPPEYGGVSDETLAQIIDRETGVAELAGALKKMLDAKTVNELLAVHAECRAVLARHAKS